MRFKDDLVWEYTGLAPTTFEPKGIQRTRCQYCLMTVIRHSAIDVKDFTNLKEWSVPNE